MASKLNEALPESFKWIYVSIPLLIGLFMLAIVLIVDICHPKRKIFK